MNSFKDIYRYIPNIVTLSRILLTILFLKQLNTFLIEDMSYIMEIYLILTFVLICFTDLFDGIIARKLNVVTKEGAILDVMTDFIFIISTYIIFNINGIIATWFVILIVLKFTEFLITSFFISKKRIKKGSNIFVFDIIGRATAVIFYLIPGIICVCRIIAQTKYMQILLYIEILTFILTIISTIYRIYNACNFKKHLNR